MKQVLHVARFNKGNDSSPIKQFTPIQLGVRCSLPGWVQRVEFIERKPSYLGAVDAYNEDHGQRVALIDSMGTVIVCGWIYEVVPDGLFNHYVAGGGWKRHFDELDTTEFDPADTIDDVITDTVTNHVPALTADYSHIAGSGTAVGSIYQVEQLAGSYPGDIIETLLAISDGSANVYDYWLESRPLAGTTLRYPLAYLQARAAAGTPDWRVGRRDLAGNPLSARHIWDLKTRITTRYEQSTNINNGGGYAAGTSTLTVDDASIFTSGDRCRLYLTAGQIHSTAISGVSGSDITLNDPLPGAISDNARVVNESSVATTTSTNADAESLYWRRDFQDTTHIFDQTQAEQLRDAYAALYNEPISQGGFTIAAPTVKSGAGVTWPVWYLLQRPSYVQITDLYPTAALNSLSLDRLTSFFTTSLDYDGYTMRVTPDNPDSRLDALLHRAGILPGEIVQRGTL